MEAIQVTEIQDHRTTAATERTLTAGIRAQAQVQETEHRVHRTAAATDQTTTAVEILAHHQATHHLEADHPEAVIAAADQVQGTVRDRAVRDPEAAHPIRVVHHQALHIHEEEDNKRTGIGYHCPILFFSLK